MTVQVVTDSSSCLPETLAAEAGVTVMDLHVTGSGSDATTSGLGALELTAMYARLLERGGDDGVVAIHLSKELSATWSHAVTAAGIFDGAVKVLDTNSAGMVLGFAALRAARAAAQGGTVDEVADVARSVIQDCSLLLYVHKLDSLRRGGRLSAGQSLLTTALASKPILQLVEGRLTVTAKTRTQSKAMTKLVEAVRNAVHKEMDSFLTDATATGESTPRTIYVAIQQADAEETAHDVHERMRTMLQSLEEEIRSSEDSPWKDIPFPEVKILTVPMDNGIKVHVGPGSVAVTILCD